jgi:hypothetical protein
MMLIRSGLLALVVVLSLNTGPAFASICLGKSLSLDETVDAIKATSGCESAMKLFKDCQYSASGDVSLGAAVEKKCEADFLDKASASTKQAYERERSVCNRKYRNKSGTMYISFAAFCRAEVAQRYSRRALKAKAGSR